MGQLTEVNVAQAVSLQEVDELDGIGIWSGGLKDEVVEQGCAVETEVSFVEHWSTEEGSKVCADWWVVSEKVCGVQPPSPRQRWAGHPRNVKTAQPWEPPEDGRRWRRWGLGRVRWVSWGQWESCRCCMVVKVSLECSIWVCLDKWGNCWWGTVPCLQGSLKL